MLSACANDSPQASGYSRSQFSPRLEGRIARDALRHSPTVSKIHDLHGRHSEYERRSSECLHQVAPLQHSTVSATIASKHLSSRLPTSSTELHHVIPFSASMRVFAPIALRLVLPQVCQSASDLQVVICATIVCLANSQAACQLRLHASTSRASSSLTLDPRSSSLSELAVATAAIHPRHGPNRRT